ncbi:unnamed protein product [Diabrotica balteata]|uniref:F-box/LRR-repeat protein 15-like leucin rich repeat domain-containing protein n=1 Tax=Diabrotica balteata TaxID=107213 RepID=A0A9N9SWK3_DIABA|nr:unnamed protein product [Diabrotica balteata]
MFKSRKWDVGVQALPMPIDSLFSLAIDYVVDNLAIYMKENDERLSALPYSIKNRILRRFTTSAYFWRNINFKSVLLAIANEQTLSINLTSAPLDDEILKIISKCKNVRKLYLSRNDDGLITTKGLVELWKNCTNLISFVLCRSTEVRDEVLDCMAEHCPNMTCLDLGGCPQITDIGIKKISRLKKLTSVNFSATQITDEGTSCLARGPSGPKLTELRIEDTQVTDVGLRDIAENCPNLQILCYRGRQRQDLDDFVPFHNELKNLKQVTWTVNW